MISTCCSVLAFSIFVIFVICFSEKNIYCGKRGFFVFFSIPAFIICNVLLFYCLWWVVLSKLWGKSFCVKQFIVINSIFLYKNLFKVSNEGTWSLIVYCDKASFGDFQPVFIQMDLAQMFFAVLKDISKISWRCSRSF